MEICIETCREERHFSLCKEYSYKRCITWCDGKPPCVFVMLNPKGSEPAVYSKTVRNCIGIAKQQECGSIIIVNLYARRAENVDTLARCKNIVEDKKGQNLKYIRSALTAPNNTKVIASWGVAKGKEAEIDITKEVNEFIKLAKDLKKSISYICWSREYNQPNHISIKKVSDKLKANEYMELNDFPLNKN